MQIDSRFGRWVATALLMAGAVTVFVTTASAEDRGVEGVSYTLIPTIEAMRWSEDMGLKDTELYGGRLGINFGQLLSLQGFYLGRDGARTDLADSGLLDGVGDPLLDQDLEIRSVGADLVINLKRQGMVPFVKAGAGVLRFRTADGDENDEIGLRLGGGLRFGSERYRFMAYVEDAMYHSDRYALAAGGGGALVDPTANELRHNLAFGAGLDLRLGGQRHTGLTSTDRALMDRYRSGLGGVSWPLEPFYERISFADVVDLPSQDFLGLRTGLDFGRYVGLRGWFAQGVNDSFDGTSPIQTFGGELFFNLNAGQGAIPYLIAGVGKLDFESAYRDGDGLVRDDETMLTLGGGLAFTVSDRVRVDLALRDHILSQDDLDATTSTDQLSHNWGWSAGVRMAFGGGRSLMSPARPEPAPLPPLGTGETEAAAGEPAPVVETVAAPVAEQAAPEAAPVIESTPVAAPEAAVVDTYHGERRITIPLPTEGEIYLRYGRPGGVNINSNYERREDVIETPQTPAAVPAEAPVKAAETQPAAPVAEPVAAPATEATAAQTVPALDLEALRALLREELDHERELREEAEAKAAAERAETATQTAPDAPTPETETAQPAASAGLTPEEQLDLLELRLADRIDARIEARARELAASMTTAPVGQQPSTIVVESPAPAVVTESSGRSWSPRGFDTFLGATVDDPGQFLLGGRLDLGPLSQGGRVHFVPELSLGFGGGATSYMMAGNFIRHFGRTDEPGTWAPFVGVGVGIMGFSEEVGDRSKREGVLNLSYGATVNMGDTTAFVEHQGVDLFDMNRILLGLRWPLGR